MIWNGCGRCRSSVILKGVLSAEDGRRAVAWRGRSDRSNHGGRNLDTVPATIDALPRVVDAVAGRIPVIWIAVFVAEQMCWRVGAGRESCVYRTAVCVWPGCGGAKGVERVYRFFAMN